MQKEKKKKKKIKQRQQWPLDPRSNGLQLKPVRLEE